MSKFNPEDIEVLDKLDPVIISSKEDAIILSKILFKSKKYLDIRRYYLTESGKFLPTTRGIWIPFEGEGFTIKSILTNALEFIEEEE